MLFHLKSFGACGLDIFFVISGFIVSLVATRAVARNQPSARTFLSRRFTRIFPLYWILTVVIVLEAQFGGRKKRRANEKSRLPLRKFRAAR